jgi:molybdate transport system substrate-binding protein
MRRAARYVSTLLLLNISVLLSSPLANAQQQILVAAAADLEPLQPELTKAFSVETHAAVTFTFAASGSLAQQIDHGAPYDVFLSANDLFVKNLASSGRLLADTIVVYAYGRIALWSKNPRIRSLPDLLRPEVRHLAIANPAHAPYGIAAKEALINQRLWDKLQPKIVYGENVAETFQYARSGNADAAIVSSSLVFDKGGILLSSSWHRRISQSGAVVKGSPHEALARAFLKLLTERQGRTILRQFGFQLPE